MSQLEDLCEVHSDLPKVPRRELCALAIQLIEDGDPLIESLRARLRTTTIVPEDVVEFLAPLLDPTFPDRPLAWHFARALARQRHDMRPMLDPDAQRAIEAAPSLVERVAAGAQGFLLNNLRAGGPDPWVLAHLEAEFCPAALDVVAGFRRLPAARLPAGLAAAAVRGAAARLEASGVRETEQPGDLRLTTYTPDLLVLADWLEAVVREREDTALLFAAVPEPLPLRILTAPRIRWTEEGVCEVDGERWSEEQAKTAFGPEVTFVGRTPTGSELTSVRCDLRGLRFPADPRAAGEAALALVRAQRAFTATVAGALGRFGEGLTPDQLIALAAADPRLLLCVTERWPKALDGAAALVESAQAVGSPAERVRVLLALGAPAKVALAKTVEALLHAFPETGVDVLLVQIADSSPLLNLSFWEKQASRPGTFKALAGSQRLRACWRLRPQGLVRAMKALAKHGAVKEALTVLSWLFMHARHALLEATPEVIALLDQAIPDHWGADDGLIVLARLDTPEAHAAVRVMLDKVALEPTNALFVAVHHDLLWELLSARGLADAPRVLQWCYRGSTRGLQVTRAAARALVAHIIEHGLGDVAEEAASNQHLLAEAIYWHRSEEEAHRIAALLPGFDGIRFEDDDRDGLGDAARDRDPRWLEALQDDDRALLLGEIGALCAAHHGDKAWANEIPRILGEALRARCRVVLRESGERLLQHLGERWPTRTALESAASDLGTEIDPKDLDRCADEGLPPLFRAVVSALPSDISGTDDPIKTTPEFWLDWILEKCWTEDPALIARHLVGELAEDRPLPWLRGVALALVALREPVGTTIPDALTHLAHQVPDAKEFLLRQRDTFARESAAAERAKPAAYRTRQALYRLKRAAREATRAEQQRR